VKTLFIRAAGIVALTLVLLIANAQTPAPELKHFSKGGLSFDYPADVGLQDKSESGGQKLVLTHADHGAQIIITARYQLIDSAEQIAQAKKEVLDSFVDRMVKEFESQKTHVEHAERQIEVGGSQASGVRLRCVLNGQPENAEVYSTVIERRLVMVSFIGSDKELRAAASAWSTVRTSLRVGQTVDSLTSALSSLSDVGSVTGTTYENKYFGLRLTIPTSWQVLDSNVRKRISEKGKELMTSDDPSKQRDLNRAADNTINLLTVAQYPPGEAQPPNSMLICGAERIPARVGKDTEYMAALKNTLKYSQVPITVERDIYSEQIGEVAFSVIDFKSNYSGKIVSQKYYAHIIKNYVLFFIVIYQMDEQLKTLNEVLRSAVLQ